MPITPQHRFPSRPKYYLRELEAEYRAGKQEALTRAIEYCGFFSVVNSQMGGPNANVCLSGWKG
jgi:hypothetical protein